MITDDTLREGLQAPGMSFTTDEKLSLARIIGSYGIKSALVSYPIAHSSEVDITEKIVSDKIFKEVFALGRAIKSDVDAIDATGANIALHLPFRLENIEKVTEAVKYASTKGKMVEVSVVDVMKNTPEQIIKIAKMIEEAGADIIQLPDTTGIGTPKKIGRLFSMARSAIKCEIDAHCHNDNGLSVANAIAALENGADRIDTTVYGIGERNGITDVAPINRALELNGVNTGLNTDSMRRAYESVLELIISKAGPEFFMDNAPIYGRNIYTNTAGTHVAYSDVFTGKEMSFNVYAGKSMISTLLASNKIIIGDNSLSLLLKEVKDRAVSTGKCVTPKEIIKMAGEFSA